MDDDGSANNAAFPLQISESVGEIRGKISVGVDENVAPIADMALVGGDVAVSLPLGIEMSSGRLTPVAHNVTRLMDVKPVLLGRGFRFEAGQLDGHFQIFAGDLPERDGAIDRIVASGGQVQAGI